MRRKTDADIRRESLGLIVFSVFFILIGVLLVFAPIIDPPAQYDELMETEVTVSSIRRIIQYRGANYMVLTTTENEKYILTGDYVISEVNDALQQGQKITIKYDKSRLFFRRGVEVVIAGGKEIVRYNNDENQTDVIVAGCVAVLVGTGLWGGYRWFLIHNRRIQAKRDARISQKYGSAKRKR